MFSKQQSANIQKAIGKQVRKLRVAMGATQQEAADRCGMYRTYLSRVENGSANPSIQVLADLANLFGVEIGSLFVGIEGTTQVPPVVVQASPPVKRAMERLEAASGLEFAGIALADRRALLQFCLNWIGHVSERSAKAGDIAPAYAMGADEQARYRSQICTVCRQSKLVACDAPFCADHQCALVRTGTSSSSRASAALV